MLRYSYFIQLDDLSGEIEIRDIRRAALAISAEIVLIAKAKVDVHVRPVGDIFNEHTSM